MEIDPSDVCALEVQKKFSQEVKKSNLGVKRKRVESESETESESEDEEELLIQKNAKRIKSTDASSVPTLSASDDESRRHRPRHLQVLLACLPTRLSSRQTIFRIFGLHNGCANFMHEECVF